MHTHMYMCVYTHTERSVHTNTQYSPYVYTHTHVNILCIIYRDVYTQRVSPSINMHLKIHNTVSLCMHMYYIRTSIYTSVS